WRRIQIASDEYGTFPPEKFEQQFGRDERVLAERQLYLCDGDGEAIGTMTAWLGERAQWERWGRVHWVAVLPEMQGRGLSKPLMAATMNRLRQLGHERGYLTTATVRPAAINLYLKFGFVPLVRHDADARAWRLVAPCLRPEYWGQVVAKLPELAV
ncbi:GNAT family N-acetyltransferase, partial [Planctomycetota bacterium]